MRRVALSQRETRGDELASEVSGSHNPEHGHLPVDPKWEPGPKRAEPCSWDIVLSFGLRNRSQKCPALQPSDMTKSGDSERAAASASSGEVKDLAEKPFIRNMAARVDAMTRSSSTTKMREPGDT
jgi:hypothetical protein